jgi:hypothetical protein
MNTLQDDDNQGLLLDSSSEEELNAERPYERRKVRSLADKFDKFFEPKNFESKKSGE